MPWAILDVEISEGPGALPAAPNRPALIVLRRNGAVLGSAHILPTDLPMTDAEFARIAARAVARTVSEIVRLGARDEAIAPATSRSDADVLASKSDLLLRLDAALAERRRRPITLGASIVVCTRKRAPELAECLASMDQERASGREIIVVDNGPDPETEAVVRSLPGVRYVVEPEPGLNRARNAGLRAAREDIVVFVDDDVRPEPGWVEALLRRFDRPEVGVVCGLVLPDELQTDAQVAFQYELGFGGMGFVPLAFDSSFLAVWSGWGAPVWEIGAGANMAVRREVGLRLGFDDRIGAGRIGGCGDDAAFWHSVLNAGGEARYEPLSVVRHRHRSTWPELKRQAHGYGAGHAISLYVTFAQGRRLGDLKRAFIYLPLWYVNRVRRAPMRWLLGDPDRLLTSSLLGYLSSFRHLGLLWPRRREPPRAPERAPAGADLPT